MRAIKATCPGCGDVEVHAREIRVRFCNDTGRWDYLFRCPRCSMVATRQTSDRMADLLVRTAEVSVQYWSMPAELRERPPGPRITEDDLLDFHLLIEDDAAFIAAITAIGA